MLFDVASAGGNGQTMLLLEVVVIEIPVSKTLCTQENVMY